MTDEVRQLFDEPLKKSDYEIRISGTLNERWSSWLGDINFTVESREDGLPLTVFHCPAMDQAGLRGMLNKLWDLNLILVSVERLPPGAPPQGCQTDNE